MHLDEKMWRFEYKHLNMRKAYLCEVLNVKAYNELVESRKTESGIGGGYGLYGVLEQNEMFTVLKSARERAAKMHETRREFTANPTEWRLGNNIYGPQSYIDEEERVDIFGGELT